MEIPFTRVFRSLYGVFPHHCSFIWSFSYRKVRKSPSPIHLLWSLIFLKVYHTKSFNSSITGAGPKTFRKMDRTLHRYNFKSEFGKSNIFSKLQRKEHQQNARNIYFRCCRRNGREVWRQKKLLDFGFPERFCNPGSLFFHFFLVLTQDECSFCDIRNFNLHTLGRNIVGTWSVSYFEVQWLCHIPSQILWWN